MEINKEAIARLDEDDGEKATAFLISPQHVLTAKHIFSSRDVSGFKLCFPNLDKTKFYTLENIDFDKDIDTENLANDIAILTLIEPIYHIKPLILEFSSIKRNQEWESFGFPNSKRENGEFYEGTVDQILVNKSDQKFDLSLYCRKPQITDSRYEIEGVSGAPIISNGKVVAVFSNESSAGGIGAATLQRSRDLFEKYIPIPEEELEESPLQKAIKEAASSAENLIDGFPDEVHDYLKEELSELQQQFLDNLDDVQWFLANSKYPTADKETLADGLEAIFEIVLLIKSAHDNIQLLKNDDFANIRVESSGKFNMSFVYAQRRQQKMPEILLDMYNQMIKKSAAEVLIELERPIPPYPVILDNCSSSKRYNLCSFCGQSFEFTEILKTFLEPEDEGLIKGIEVNNFELLSKAKVVCAECIREVQNQVETQEQLEKIVGEKIYG
ncbi:ABC-three component system protein [Bacillus mycoides]|uniref:ABC-three component system protein n=1 Tax=Bacillus mycoides TaxID=1405 RepID=UPI0011F03BC2|nr:ABC-three component system protein [Bacillus mycoides]QEL85892.1 serine protease [Bacillus mycoides]